MSNVINFDFEQKQVRMVEIEGESNFVLKDVLTAMGSKTRPANAKSLLEETLGKGVLANYPLQTKGGEQNTTVISEPALTYLVAQSRTEEGKRLNVWIHTEVLPRIRKTGGYIEGEENFQSEDELIYHAMQVMQRKITEMKPKAAWFDDYVSNDGTLNTTDVAKQLGISAQSLNKWMKAQGIKFKNKDMPKRAYADWFKVVNFNANGKVGTQSRITTEGATKITQMYKEA